MPGKKARNTLTRSMFFGERIYENVYNMHVIVIAVHLKAKLSSVCFQVTAKTVSKRSIIEFWVVVMITMTVIILIV